MDYAEYEALPGIRASRLKLMEQSPLHYLHGHDGEDTASRGALRAIHAAILEPETFDERFPVYLGKTRRGKEYDAFRAEHPGATILNSREHWQAQQVRAAVLAHPVAGPLIEAKGWAEHSIRWRYCGDSGPWCKARLDKLIPPGGWTPEIESEEPATIIDLKGYGTTDPRQIARRVVANGAHIQADHYLDGVAASRGWLCRYLIISYEIVAPYDVAVVELTADDALRIGREKREELLAKVLDCERSGKWPGRCPEIVPLELPMWTDQVLDSEFITDDNAEEES